MAARCPFCGSKPALYGFENVDGQDVRFVACSKCEFSGAVTIGAIRARKLWREAIRNALKLKGAER